MCCSLPPKMFLLRRACPVLESPPHAVFRLHAKTPLYRLPFTPIHPLALRLYRPSSLSTPFSHASRSCMILLSSLLMSTRTNAQNLSHTVPLPSVAVHSARLSCLRSSSPSSPAPYVHSASHPRKYASTHPTPLYVPLLGRTPVSLVHVGKFPSNTSSASQCAASRKHCPRVGTPPSHKKRFHSAILRVAPSVAPQPAVSPTPSSTARLKSTVLVLRCTRGPRLASPRLTFRSRLSGLHTLFVPRHYAEPSVVGAVPIIACVPRSCSFRFA
ncbi:hypothetical protein TRVL_06323 [Trypanosoma vivax]|nr:hypothetical protein TRVL_06323 [Trypanosoma vivax]